MSDLEAMSRRAYDGGQVSGFQVLAREIMRLKGEAVREEKPVFRGGGWMLNACGVCEAEAGVTCYLDCSNDNCDCPTHRPPVAASAPPTREVWTRPRDRDWASEFVTDFMAGKVTYEEMYKQLLRAPSSPEQSAEPVAWAIESESPSLGTRHLTYFYHADEREKAGRAAASKSYRNGRVVPLYASPPAAPALHEEREGYVLCCCGDHLRPAAPEPVHPVRKALVAMLHAYVHGATGEYRQSLVRQAEDALYGATDPSHSRFGAPEPVQEPALHSSDGLKENAPKFSSGAQEPEQRQSEEERRIVLTPCESDLGATWRDPAGLRWQPVPHASHAQPSPDRSERRKEAERLIDEFDLALGRLQDLSGDVMLGDERPNRKVKQARIEAAQAARRTLLDYAAGTPQETREPPDDSGMWVVLRVEGSIGAYLDEAGREWRPVAQEGPERAPSRIERQLREEAEKRREWPEWLKKTRDLDTDGQPPAVAESERERLLEGLDDVAGYHPEAGEQP